MASNYCLGIQASEQDILKYLIKWGEHQLIKRMADRGERPIPPSFSLPLFFPPSPFGPSLSSPLAPFGVGGRYPHPLIQAQILFHSPSCNGYS